MLMFATAMLLFGSASVRVDVTQLMPQMMSDVSPMPASLSTLTA